MVRMTFEKIEREIADLERSDMISDNGLSRPAKSMRLMLDVVRAADETVNGETDRHKYASGQVFVDVGSLDAQKRALTALREHCDGD